MKEKKFLGDSVIINMIDAKEVGDERKNFLVCRQICYLVFLRKTDQLLG